MRDARLSTVVVTFLYPRPGRGLCAVFGLVGLGVRR
jgi:hypothetical protein